MRCNLKSTVVNRKISIVICKDEMYERMQCKSALQALKAVFTRWSMSDVAVHMPGKYGMNHSSSLLPKDCATTAVLWLGERGRDLYACEHCLVRDCDTSWLWYIVIVTSLGACDRDICQESCITTDLADTVGAGDGVQGLARLIYRGLLGSCMLRLSIVLFLCSWCESTVFVTISTEA